MSSQADQLKAEGNALFAKKKFTAAYKKYSDALEHDDKNPILYSNRAACCLNLNRFVDACTDATKATDIDPAYAKAWARLATAKMGLRRVVEAVDAWKRALGALPVENLTAAEQKQRDEYSSELAKANAKLEGTKAHPKALEVVSREDQERLPWKKARALLPGLTASQTWDSSAWVITKAYSSWEAAMKGMEEIQARQTPTGLMYFGRSGVIESLSNALMEDRRVFGVPDGGDFLFRYNRQVEIEVSSSKAWSKGGSSQVRQEAPKRLEAEGWDSVRPALSVTVRAWVLLALLQDTVKLNLEAALELYDYAIDVLEWGAQRWKDVPFEDKGAIFQPTVVCAIKCLRIDTLFKAHGQNPDKFPCEQLLASADDILSELKDAPQSPGTLDTTFFLSFYRYPLGKAHSTRGFCLFSKAKRLRIAIGGDRTEDIVKQCLDASAEYLKAADSYPKDDENHAWSLHSAYRIQLDCGTTLESVLQILDRLKESVPMMRAIWEFTPKSVSERDRALDTDLKERDGFLQAINGKEVEMDKAFILRP